MTAMSATDVAAHVSAQGPVRTSRPQKPARTVLESFQASAPRGSWPAEEFAADRRREGVPARVVMDLDSDSFLVIVDGGER